MNTAHFAPATANSVLSSTVANLAAINDQLSSELSHARMEIARLTDQLEQCNCASAAAAEETETVPVPETKTKPKKKPDNIKTKLCRNFEETGECRFGNKCLFAHGAEELRTVGPE